MNSPIATPDMMYRLLVEGVVDYAIYMLTPEDIVANWNAGARRAKGYTSAEIVGQHYSRFYTAADVAAGAPAKTSRASRARFRATRR